jgi:MFS family permease
MNRLTRHFNGLWRHPDFMKLWVGQTVSEFGSHITGTGLPLVAVITLSVSPSELGVLTALSSIPGLIFSLFVGVWVDRLPRRPIMIAMDIARVTLLMSVPVAAFSGHLSMALLYIVTPLLALFTLIYNVAYQALLPTLVTREHLLEGNTKLATTSSLAEVGGQAVAGALIQIVTAPVAIIFDAISFLFSAVSLGLIRTSEVRTRPIVQSSMLDEVCEGFNVIMRQPVLRALVIAMSVRTFFGYFFAALYSLYVVREVGLSPFALGVLIGAGGVGALAGALLANRFTYRFGFGSILVLMAVNSILGLLTPLAGIVGSTVLAMVFLTFNQVVGDALYAIYVINETTLRQMLVPDHLLGRANASAEFLSQCVSPLGALVAGALAAFTSSGFTLLIAALGMMGVSLWMLTTPVRQFRHIPLGEAAD